MRTFSLALIALTAGSTHAGAQQAPQEAPPRATIAMDLAVTDAIRSVLAGQFDEGHVAMLQALGHQQAVASTCRGFAIDPRLFSEEFNLIYDDAKGQPRPLDTEQRKALERQATMALGMSFGAQIAIASTDHESFCRAAAQEREGGKVDHLIWAK